MSTEMKTKFKLNGNQKVIRNMKPRIDFKNQDFVAMLREDKERARELLDPAEYYVWDYLMDIPPYYISKGNPYYVDYVLCRHQLVKSDEHEGLSEWTYKKAVNGLIEKGYLCHVKGNLYTVYNQQYEDEI